MRQFPALALLSLGACLPASPYTTLILPFANAGNNRNHDWIGESLAETVREVLAANGMPAIDREDRMETFRRLSLRPYSRLTKASVIKIASELDASHAIYGAFEIRAESGAAQSIRITAQVVRLDKIIRGPEYVEDGPLGDLAALQSRLAWRTLSFILPERAPSEQQFRSQTPLHRVEAIENYTRGLLATTPDQKLKFFTQAVKAEPAFSQANFQLGRMQLERKNWKNAAEHLLKVAAADSRFREATFLLGIARYRMNDFAAAETAFSKVAAEVPLSEVWNNLAAAQSRRNASAALDNFEKALDGDRNDPDYHFNVGYALFKRGQLPDAAERFRAVLDRIPQDSQALTMLGRCLKRGSARNRDSALEGMERLKENYEESAYVQLKAVLEGNKANP